MTSRWFGILFVALIIVAGLFVRLWGILQGGFAFTYDAGRDLLAVRDLVYGGKVSLIGPTSGQMGVFYGPWYWWILAVPFAIFGGNPTAMVSFIAVLGAAAAGLAFWWGQRFFGTLFAIVFSAMLAVSPVIVGSTNQLWSPHLVVPVMVAIIVLWSKIRRIGPIGLIGLGFLVGLLDELEIVYGVVFTAGFLVSLLLWQRATLLSKKSIWLIGGILLTEAPRILFELRHQFLQTRALSTLAGTSSLTWNRLRPAFLWEQVTAVLPEGAWWMRVLLVAAVVGLVVVAVRGKGGKSSKGKRIFLAELLTLLVVFTLFVLLYSRDVWPYYLIGLPVILSVFIALAFSALTKLVTPAILAILIVMFLFFVTKPVEFVTAIVNPPFVGDAAVYRNQQEVIRYIYRESQGKDFNIIVYTPPQIDYPWRYLWWWMRRTYGFGQTDLHTETLFVIVEPDYGYLERQRQWLAMRKNDGKIVKQIMFPSGTMVQTRKRFTNNDL